MRFRVVDGKKVECCNHLYPPGKYKEGHLPFYCRKFMLRFYNWPEECADCKYFE